MILSNLDFKVMILFNVSNSKTVQDRAIFTTVDQQKGAIFNNLEQSITQFIRSRSDAEYLVNG